VPTNAEEIASSVDWSDLTVKGTDYTPDPAREVSWTSDDGRVTWTLAP
jgi:hypothetical protein